VALVSSFYLKRALKLGIPVVAGQLGFILMGATDTVMVGKVSNDAQAAVGLGNSIFFLVMILGYGILFGITSLVSIADGEGKLNDSWRYIKTGLKLLIPITIILYFMLWFVGFNFSILDQPKNISILAVDYINVINLSTPFLFVATLYASFLNGLGKTIPNMVITFICLIANYYLNIWFIFGLGNVIPAMGFIGSGYATVISRILLCVITIIYCYQNEVVVSIRRAYVQTVSFFTTAREILKFGIPVGTQLFLEIFAFTASFVIAGWLGALSLTAHQVVLNIASITFMFVTGISTAAGIMIGNGYGAKDKNHIFESAKACIFIVATLELFFCSIFMLFGKELLAIYSDDATLIAFAAPLMFVAAAFQVSDGLQNLGLNMLRGMHDVHKPALIAFFSYWIVMVPVSLYLAMPWGLAMGIDGVWWGFVIGLSLASIILIPRFFMHLRTIQNKW